MLHYIWYSHITLDHTLTVLKLLIQFSNYKQDNSGSISMVFDAFFKGNGALYLIDTAWSMGSIVATQTKKFVVANLVYIARCSKIILSIAQLK